MIRKRPLVCPHCTRKLPFRTYSTYFLRGTDYVVLCPHCHQSIKPIKEPIPFLLCVQAGVAVGVIGFFFYVSYIHDDVAEAIGFTLLCGLVLVFATCFLTYQRIHFTRA